MSKEKKSNWLNILLWATQIFLALIFILAGMMKAFQPIEEIGQSMPWVLETPAAFVRFIGISELFGAIGLILPSVLRIRPRLTVYAAFALLFVIMAGFVMHVSRGEYSFIWINVIIALMTWFVGWGRSKRLPIPPKS